MATLYVDFENGNDNYGGSSFALLASGTNGRITSSTFSAAGASFPNDGSLIGQYLSIFNGTIYAVYNITAWVSSTSLTIAAISGGTALANQTVDRQYYIGGRWKSLTNGATAVRIAPGDTVRMMGSPAPTSLGINGTWTSQALQGTKNITGATNATPISITCTAHGYSTGDTVVITGVGGNTEANGTWEITSTGANTFTLDGSAGNATYTSGGTVRLRNNTRIKLASAVTANIASTGPGRSAWTASSNISTSLSTGQYKEHSYSDLITISLSFTTGKAAYYATGTLNLSSYQQVSFWIRQNSGTLINAGDIELRLCSDTIGATTVNIIGIPAIPVLNQWMPVTVDLGTNLGSSIQSIALYVNFDNSTQQIQLSNIIACKASSAADSLTLTSLIGKNTTGETWWGIQSIDGTMVMLDASTNNLPTDAAVRGYYGTSETVTTWKRETIKLGPAATSTTVLQTIQESGTDGSPITFSGGWDRTAMSTQSLETWMDGVNGNGYGISSSGLVFVNTEKTAYVRFTRGFSASGNAYSQSHSILAANNCTTSASHGAFSFSGNQTGLILDHVVANAGVGILLSAWMGPVTINKQVCSNGSSGIFLDRGLPKFFINGPSTALIANNGSYALEINSGSITVSGFSTESNANGAILIGANAIDTYLNKCLINDAIETTFGVASFPSVFSQNHDQTADNHKIFMSGALVSSATDQRKTASGISWKMQPTSAIRSSAWPVSLSLAKVACAANSQVTIKAWMRRDNAGLTMRLVCKGGQIAGVASDVTASVTTTNAWEEETITFTPTETGVVEITAEAWGGTTYSGWVDDMTISQA